MVKLGSQIQSCTSQDKHRPELNLRTRTAKMCIYILSCSFGKDIVCGSMDILRLYLFRTSKLCEDFVESSVPFENP